MIRKIVICILSVLLLRVCGANVQPDESRSALLKTPFVFFDFEEPLILFFLDYLAVMGLFVCIGHYGSKLLR